MKNFNGKAIYQPSGKAAEYSKWACNLYVGCSNGCEYCYLKHGRGAAVLGGDKPTLKKCFKNEKHAMEVFDKELKENLSELQKHGLFLSFTTDPMLESTIRLTYYAIGTTNANEVPIKVLTKCVGWVDEFIDFMNNSNSDNEAREWRKLIAFGFTLTGHDELEQGASTNQDRIDAMKKLRDAGFKTFASIEPIIDFESSLRMIIQTSGCCDLLKVGLQSGKKYNHDELLKFVETVTFITRLTRKVYWKDSLLKAARIDRKDLPANCVTRDFNLFNSKLC